MDTIQKIYQEIPHYKESFELGVLHNNKAAAFITISLFKDTVEVYYLMKPYSLFSKDSLLSLAEKEIKSSIDLYENWLLEYDSLNELQVKEKIQLEFLNGVEGLDNEEQEGMLSVRVEEIIEAQVETKRRLSVSYTNLGIVYRHKEEYEKAANQYIKALELWEDNLSAENNLNILLGKPLKKRTLVQRLFPKRK